MPGSRGKGLSDSVREAAALLGSYGGGKGGRQRAANMTPAQRSEAARKAALHRWHGPGAGEGREEAGP